MKLADLTTIAVGGEIDEFIEVDSEKDFIDAIKCADKHFKKLLVLGGGSNLLPHDGRFKGCAVKYSRGAGKELDLVCQELRIPHLAGIPGSLGGAVVQNAGAYGAEIANYLLAAKVFDRKTAEIVELNVDKMNFEYRNSALKKSIGFLNSYSPRWIVLDAKLKEVGAEHFNVQYPRILKELDVEQNELVDYDTFRDAVLKIRSENGVLAPSQVNADDAGRQSAGSFFKNPVVDRFEIENGRILLPHYAPIYEVPGSNNLVKISAAWLIQHSGISRKYSKGAGISSKHALVLINPELSYYEKSGEELRELMRHIIVRVQEIYNIALEVEPIIM
ncbi:MAG: hypothetical protein LBP35_06285 [Candidatus Ancillula trichonymphae]|jgi:UDP-N-acetylmuramate dehydrogenase|nr:hypothetical protein [Candidatus Ancillula trichonymphae]